MSPSAQCEPAPQEEDLVFLCTPACASMSVRRSPVDIGDEMGIREVGMIQVWVREGGE